MVGSRFDNDEPRKGQAANVLLVLSRPCSSDLTNATLIKKRTRRLCRTSTDLQLINPTQRSLPALATDPLFPKSTTKTTDLFTSHDTV